MSNIIFTASGCARCQITKRFMADHNIDYEEFDIKGEGKDAFGRFYRANRKDIFRDQDGVEFPVFGDGREIRQGVSVIIGYLVSHGGLDGFIKRSLLHGEWIDGFDVSGGDAQAVGDFIAVLGYLKGKGLKIQLASNGLNSTVLQRLATEGLGDRLLMEVRGPASLWPALYGKTGIEEDIRRSLSLAPRFEDYRFFTRIAPVKRADGEASFLSPEEVAETARLIEEATGSKKNPYLLRVSQPGEIEGDDFRSVEPLPSSALFKYRSAARRYQVLTEVEK